MRAVGHNPQAASFAGIPVNRVLMKTALLSGGLAALAGFSEVSGLKGNLSLDLSPGYGYSGIVVAMLAMLNPLGVVASRHLRRRHLRRRRRHEPRRPGAELHRRRHGRDRAAHHGRGDPADAVPGEVAVMDALEILFTASFWVAAIRIASPLIFATMGELICERAGVLNLGIEGIMTAGAFAGWFTVYAGGDLWTGVRGRGPCRRHVRPAPRDADGAARPVAACGRHRRHAARHQPDLFHLPAGAAGGHLAAQDRAVRAAAHPRPVANPGHRRGAVLPDAADLSGLRHGRARRLGALPHAARPRHPRRRREPVGRRGAGHQRHRASAWAR